MNGNQDNGEYSGNIRLSLTDKPKIDLIRKLEIKQKCC